MSLTEVGRGVWLVRVWGSIADVWTEWKVREDEAKEWGESESSDGRIRMVQLTLAQMPLGT